VIDATGEPVGIMSTDSALQMAYDRGLDLVLMAPGANPPVARMMDYGKYRFECEKKEKEAKKKQQTVELKEIQLSYRIDTHDFETKARHARRFLESGNKVRVVMRFRGREMSHQELGREMASRIEADLGEDIVIESRPRLEGRQMVMMIAPKKKI
jgi:translation initiation factor IF-3